MRMLQNTAVRPVGGLSFGPDGQSLVAGGSGGYDVWDLATFTHTFIPSHNTKYLYACDYDPLGRCIYVSDSPGGLRLLSPDGGGAWRLPGGENHVISLGLSSDGSRVVMSRGGGGFNRLECWTVLPDGALAARWVFRNGEFVSAEGPHYFERNDWFFSRVALQADGTRLGTIEERRRNSSRSDRLVVIRDDDGRMVEELGKSATSFFARLHFARDGKSLFVCDDRLIERWDVTSGHRTQRPAPGRANLRGMVIDPAGHFLLTVAGDGQARYWDPATLSPLQALKWAVGKLHSVALSPDGTLAAAGGEKGQVVLWDIDL